MVIFRGPIDLPALVGQLNGAGERGVAHHPGFIRRSNLTSFRENPRSNCPQSKPTFSAPSGVVIDWSASFRCNHTSLVSPPARTLTSTADSGGGHVVGLRRRGQKVDLLAGVRQILDHRQPEPGAGRDPGPLGGVAVQRQLAPRDHAVVQLSVRSLQELQAVVRRRPPDGDTRT